MFHILNLSAYTSPQINESKKGDFVEYGIDNNYFNYLKLSESSFIYKFFF
jgi:hypothetical protein